VVEPEALMDRAREIALEIAENTAPVSVALTRQMLWRFSGEPDPWGALKVDGAMAMTLGAGPDVREGVAAFLEKRAPDFTGKVSTDMPPQYPWWKD
jgi:enoyl-CoA hydratase/carnithine racemase